MRWRWIVGRRRDETAAIAPGHDQAAAAVRTTKSAKSLSSLAPLSTALTLPTPLAATLTPSEPLAPTASPLLSALVENSIHCPVGLKVPAIAAPAVAVAHDVVAAVIDDIGRLKVLTDRFLETEALDTAIAQVLLEDLEAGRIEPHGIWWLER